MLTYEEGKRVIKYAENWIALHPTQLSRKTLSANCGGLLYWYDRRESDRADKCNFLTL